MRLRDLKSILRKPVLVGCAALLAVGFGGCQEGKDGSDNLGTNWINPAEMMRAGRQSLQLPILSSLGSGFDEPNEEFPNARNVEAADLRVDAADYVIGKNDLLQISLTDVTPGVETVKTARVSESGNISLPLIGQIPAAGLTEAQLERAIQQKYQEQGIVKNAQVSVTVVEARQRTFQIRGAVARPGQYAIVQTDFRVLDALVLAGDVQVPNIDYLYVIRPVKAANAATQPSTAPAEPVKPAPQPGLLEPKPKADTLTPAEKTDTAPATPKASGDTTLEDTNKPKDGEKSLPVFVNGNTAVDNANAAKPADAGTTAMPTTPAPGGKDFQFNGPSLPEDQSTIIRVPLRQLLNGDLKYNVVIHPQDTIVVQTPEAGEFYMGGHVQRVGVYSLTGRQITLKQAIISAGMLDEIAIPERTEIIRRIGRDKEVFVRVNLAKVFKGQQPDVFLKPYDIVQVGTNTPAPFIAAVRNAFRITYGFGFLYDRNYFQDNTQNNR